MKKEYVFSPCARPLKSLKGRAREVRKKVPTLSQTEALDQTAHEIGYRSWADMKGRCSLLVDQFFQAMFSLRNEVAFNQVYRQYLSKYGLYESTDSFRRYVLALLGASESIIPSCSETEVIDFDNKDLLDNLMSSIYQSGVDACLPQNQSNKQLFALRSIAETLLVEDEAEEQTDIDLEPLLLMVLSILAAQRQSPDLNVSTEELYEFVRLYAVTLSCEVISRTSLMKFEPPTLENVFDASRQVRVTISNDL